jgi:hypothetical protein
VFTLNSVALVRERTVHVILLICPCSLVGFIFKILLFYNKCHNSKFVHFLVSVIERKVCRCTFNRFSVITQFAKRTAGEELCRHCTQKIISLQTL